MVKIGGIKYVTLVNNKFVKVNKNTKGAVGVFIAGGKEVDEKVAAARQRNLMKEIAQSKKKK